MSWEDKPTEGQISALFHMIRWEMPTAEAQDAVNWLKENANRRQASDELGRIRELKMSRALDREACFRSPIWEGYFNSKCK